MSRVVPLQPQHTHRARGNANMEQDRDRDPLKRPTYEYQDGNATIKIRSALPFMSPEDQKRWFEENDSLPEVRLFKRQWIQSLISVAKKEAARNPDTA